MFHQLRIRCNVSGSCLRVLWEFPCVYIITIFYMVGAYWDFVRVKCAYGCDIIRGVFATSGVSAYYAGHESYFPVLRLALL